MYLSKHKIAQPFGSTTRPGCQLPYNRRREIPDFMPEFRAHFLPPDGFQNETQGILGGGFLRPIDMIHLRANHHRLRNSRADRLL
jgi:hypothetical protein